jgi:hypothetical protein
MLHRPIHATTFFLNPAYAYSCNFDFDGKMMEGLLTCLQRMVHDVDARRTINSEMEMYQEASGLFGFTDAINEWSILMPRKPLEFRSLIMCFI